MMNKASHYHWLVITSAEFNILLTLTLNTKLKVLSSLLVHPQGEEKLWYFKDYLVASKESLRWHGRHSAEVNENINLGYSQDQGYS